MLKYLTDNDKIILFHKPSEPGKINYKFSWKNIDGVGDYTKDNNILKGNFELSTKAREYCGDLYKTSYGNLKKLMAILASALKEPYLSLVCDKQSPLEIEYDIIKEWLPIKVNSYTNKSTFKPHTIEKNFIEVKQLNQLNEQLKLLDKVKLNNFEVGPLDVVNMMENIFNLLGSYVVGDKKVNEEEIKHFKNKIGHFAYASRQMKDYCNMFFELLVDLNQEYDLGQLAKEIKGELEKCYKELGSKLYEAITNLKIEKCGKDLNYYQEAIELLENYKEEEKCQKNKAICLNMIGDIKYNESINAKNAKEEEASKNLEVAIDKYKQALSLDKSLINIYEQLGDIYSKEKNYKEAIKFYKITKDIEQLKKCYNALISNADNLSAKCELHEKSGDDWYKLGLYSKAKKSYFKASQLFVKQHLIEGEGAEELIKGLAEKIHKCLSKENTNELVGFYENVVNNPIKFYSIDELDIVTLGGNSPNALDMENSGN